MTIEAQVSSKYPLPEYCQLKTEKCTQVWAARSDSGILLTVFLLLYCYKCVSTEMEHLTPQTVWVQCESFSPQLQ